MKYYIMTLVSIVTVLAIKSYTINAQDQPIDDMEVAMMASGELLNKADTIRHQKMINRFIKGIEGSEILYGKYSGSAEFSNDIYENFERIQRVGTAEELNDLLVHESPVVRLYAHKALAVNGMPMDHDKLEALVNDTTTLIQHDGFIITKVTVGDLACRNMFISNPAQ